MLIEMSPGTDNVIHSPVEMRKKPSMRLLHQLQPEVRTLFMHAEGLGFELPPHDLRDRTDEATAEHIAAHLDGDGRASQPFLDELLEPLLQRAVGSVPEGYCRCNGRYDGAAACGKRPRAGRPERAGA